MNGESLLVLPLGPRSLSRSNLPRGQTKGGKNRAGLFLCCKFRKMAKEFTPILKGTMNTIYSPTNHSVIVMPSLGYSMAKNWEFDFTGQSFFEFEDYKPLGNRIFIRFRGSF
ncbi:hypothetical protein [Aestuariivivens sediminis]|uniref:hypothetical protein n=1 Tax=Aestuariivivens sediminis TaxID=2913557 RepID=UPI001F57C605|nr:hypothetical protein [Aestuariivivens sediminis]